MTTHFFIVEETTFKYHLNYKFTGTNIDFNCDSGSVYTPILNKR